MKVLIFCLLLISLTSLAQDGETISSPRLPGANIPFAASSSETGVCRALGYADALKGSSRFGYYLEYTARVDQSGNVSRGGNDYAITAISCLNYGFKTFPKAQTVVLHQPKSGGIPISAYSPEDGVCRSAGYARAAIGSMTKGPYPVQTVVVDFRGFVSRALVGDFVLNIICINDYAPPMQPSPPQRDQPQQVEIIREPRHFDSFLPYSKSSALDGVCISQGFEKAIPGSAILGNRSEYSLKMNPKGIIVYAEDSLAITQISCVNRNYEYSQRSALLINPTLPNSSQKFSTSHNSVKGICLLNGYSDGVAESIRPSQMSELSIRVNGNGDIIDSMESTFVAKIVCTY